MGLAAFALVAGCGHAPTSPDASDDSAPVVGDSDADGFAVPDDCDDGDASIHPGADEHCDGVDEDCDGAIDDDAVDRTNAYADADGDGYGDAATATQVCTIPSGFVVNADDCDDAHAESRPGAVEICDGLDNDCDGVGDLDAPGAVAGYVDADGDSYGDPAHPMYACEPTAGMTDVGLDCDDSDPAIHPDAVEGCDDAIDSDCSGRPSNGCEFEKLSSVGATFTGEFDYERFGDSVANAGDLDGDGNDDLAIGVPSADDGGVAYVVYGDAFSYGGSIAKAYDGAVWGTSTDASAGETTEGVGDLDDDGYDDLLVTSWEPGAGGGSTDVWVFFGPVVGDLSTSDRDVTVTYDWPLVWLFEAVSDGDFDGDGTGDLAVGGVDGYFGWEGHAKSAGKVSFFAGPAADEWNTKDATATFVGGADDYAGAAMSSLRDADGDGVADVAIGAPMAGLGKGQVLVIHGPLEGAMTSASADAVYDGITGPIVTPYHHYFGDMLGLRCEWADLDGDGDLDLAMSAPWADENGTDSGAVYVAYGPHSTSFVVRDADAIVYGRSLDGLSAASPGGADFDGDARDDLVVGDRYNRTDEPDAPTGAGAALVYYGPVLGRRSTSSADVILTGQASGAGAGFDVDVLDFDGDDAPDLLVGAPDFDIAQGLVYAVPNTGL